MRSIHLLFVLPMTMMLAACSSAPSYTGTPLAGSGVRDGDATDEDEEPSDEDARSSDTMSLEDGPANPPAKPKAKGQCSGETTQKACFECCNAASPEAVDIYTRALEGCLCQSPGTCKAACAATLCGGFKADTTCADCLRGAGLACEDTAFTQCEKDAACAPMLKCAADSSCSTK